MINQVYIVLKNADFTEGRGPMLFNSCWSSVEVAEKYVMEQKGIYGSPQCERRGMEYEKHRYFNGYEIITATVRNEYDGQEVARLAAERERLLAEAAAIDEKLSKLR